MHNIITLGEFIIQRQSDFPYATGQLSRLLSALRLAAKVVNSEINKAGLVDDIMGGLGQTNVQGEQQQKLDVYANDIFINRVMARREVCGIASEENEDIIQFESEEAKKGNYVILMDPLDGSSNIDCNVSVGTIFSIYRRVSPSGTMAVLEDFLQQGVEQVCAGYIVFGSSTMMVYSTGNGVNGFTYDPTVGVFFLSHPNMMFPEQGNIYSINEGHYRYFPQGVKKYIKYCQEEAPEDNRPYTSRYIGSLVADFHRNLIKGGIYMYPPTLKNPDGKLRLLYECNPLAFLAEQAGGKASNGYQSILELQPTELHQRSPFYVGSRKMVEQVEAFLREA